MKYAVLIYDREGLFESLSEREQERLLGDYLALTTAPGVVASACLQPAGSATTVRVQEGRPLLADGPFAETKEVFGGLYVLEADDPAQAIEFASRVPAARMGGSVELRPLRHLRGDE